jgi:pyruvate formate lyase activating enzyme
MRFNVMKGRISRRGFLKGTGATVCTIGSFLPAYSGAQAASLQFAPMDPGENLYEAKFYDKLENLRVRCQLCPRKCEVADQERGYCGVRENQKGLYYTLVHSRPCAMHVDPIEKKPLFHFHPGTRAFSMATAGCNVECKFCQNWDISQFRPEDLNNLNLTPEEAVLQSKKQGCHSMAYTYSEPVVFYEYMFDCAVAGNKEGIHSVMISNGYIQEKPLLALLPHLSAVKIDLKAFTEKFYKETCFGELKPVLETLTRLKKSGIWFEIVVLVIPTLNDSEKEITAMCRWIRTYLGWDVPIHFSRFHPTYKLKNLPITPVPTLEMARRAAMDSGLPFAYIGNVPGHPGNNTYCPGCGELVIRRFGHRVIGISIHDGRCVACSREIPGIWG